MKSGPHLKRSFYCRCKCKRRSYINASYVRNVRYADAVITCSLNDGQIKLRWLAFVLAFVLAMITHKVQMKMQPRCTKMDNCLFILLAFVLAISFILCKFTRVFSCICVFVLHRLSKQAHNQNEYQLESPFPEVTERHNQGTKKFNCSSLPFGQAVIKM